MQVSCHRLEIVASVEESLSKLSHYSSLLSLAYFSRKLAEYLSMSFHTAGVILISIKGGLMHSNASLEEMPGDELHPVHYHYAEPQHVIKVNMMLTGGTDDTAWSPIHTKDAHNTFLL